jgi:hypothetical protein
MTETLWVLVAVSLAFAVGVVGPLLSSESLIRAGWLCTAAGLVLGVPTGFWYHVVLRSCLRGRGPLPHRWWLRPNDHHAGLAPSERARVLFWFRLGGAGFALTILGCVLVAASLLVLGLHAGDL